MTNGAKDGAKGGKRPGGVRARMSPLRVFAAVAAVGFGAMGFYGGLFSPSSAEPTVQAFLLDWAQRDYRAAAELTTGDPVTVAAQLQTAYRQLHAAAFYLSMGHISQHPGSADAYFHASVDLGQDGAPWDYQGHFRLRKSGSSWRVIWSPSVINPGLRPGLRLAVVTRMPQRAQLLDAHGKPLQSPSTAYAVGIRPDAISSPEATATALARATGLDYTALLGQIVAAPRTTFLRLLTLSPASYNALRDDLKHVPGLMIRQETTRLFKSIASDVVGGVDTEISSVLRKEGVSYHPGTTVGVSGLQQVYQSQLAGTPTTEVVAESQDGRQQEVLASWQGHKSRSVRTTIDAAVQRAADSAAAGTGTSTAVVAVRATTGQILAVADSKAPRLPRVDPLAGRYPPGGAFTIVSTEAVLASRLPVNATIRCTGTYSVGGQRFRNNPPVHLSATPTFASDFVHGCGTAFAGLSQLLNQNPRALTEAAQGFGIGAQWPSGPLPLRAFSGSLPVSGSLARLAANTIGQGDVQMSPLGMAMVAAHVDSGAWRPPSLTSEAAQTQAASPAAFPASRIHVLRQLMRAAVQSGAASGANVSGQKVYGQVGVAPMQEKGLYANWFVGYRGDVAFAVLQLSKSPSLSSAAGAAARFLTLAPAAG